MSTTARRSLLLGVAFVAFIGLGLPDGMLGTSWPFTRAEFGRPIEDLGLLIAVWTISGGATAALSGNVSRRIGTGGLLVVATIAGVFGVVLWAIAPVWPVFILGTVVIGLGAGLFDPGINHYVAKNHDSAPPSGPW
jgi:MFS family permease